MFSKTIFKQTMKQNWKLWAIFTALTTLMSAAMIGSFNPEIIMQAIEAGLVEEGVVSLSLVGTLATGFYGMMGVLLPLVFVVMTGNSLVATQVDKGSMAYTLSTPITRTKVVCTQALYLIMALVLMFGILTATGLATITSAHSSYDLDVIAYLNLNLGIFLLMFALSSISFLFSCVFNLTKFSLALGAGIPMAFLIIQIMSGANEDFESLRYLSLNTMYDPSAIISGGTFVPQFIILGVLGVVLYLLGITAFKRKDLPL